MSNPLRRVSGLLALFVLLLAGCATTQLNAVWKDTSYQGRPHKIMVIGVAKSAVNRRLFEDEFVRQLAASGADAVASYTILPDNKQNDQPAIAEKVKELGADAVLITRLVSRKSSRVYVPGTVYYPPAHYGSWRGYYGQSYQAMYTPGYVAESEYAIMETNLYDAGNDKLIWAASSETGLQGSSKAHIKSYVGIMVRNMVEQGLLGL